MTHCNSQRQKIFMWPVCVLQQILDPLCQLTPNMYVGIHTLKTHTTSCSWLYWQVLFAARSASRLSKPFGSCCWTDCAKWETSNPYLLHVYHLSVCVRTYMHMQYVCTSLCMAMYVYVQQCFAYTSVPMVVTQSCGAKLHEYSANCVCTCQ